MKLKELYKQVRDEQNQPQVNIEEVKQQFNQMISEFKNQGNILYNMGKYRQIAEYFNKLAENAEHYIMSEAEKNWFDDITQKRNLKELKSYASDFAKVSGEAQALQERMAALYEDMGVILNRYFDVPEPQQVQEKQLTSPETSEKERIVKGMKPAKGDFEKRYPGRGEQVMYATATKLAKQRAEGLDAVGHEDADINNDGEIDAQDQYLRKRREKISKNINK